MNARGSFLAGAVILFGSLPSGKVAAETRLSRIALPIFVPMATVQRTLEAAVPETDVGERPAGLGGIVQHDRLSWNLRRRPIALSAADAWLDAASHVSGKVSLSGRFRPIGGGIGGILGDLNPTVPFDTSIDIAADLRLRVRPRLTPTWRLDAQIEPSANIREAKIPIRGLPDLNVDRELQGEVNRKLSTLSEQLRSRLLNDRFIENAARKAWGDLCRAHRMTVAAGGNSGSQSDLWLVARPVSFRAAQPIIDASGVTIHLEVEAETRVSNIEETPACGQLPSLIIGEPRAEVSLVVPARLEYGRLSTAVNQHIVGQTINIANGALTLAVREVQLSGDAGAIEVNLHVDVRPRGIWSWLFGPTRAQIRLRTSPMLDHEPQRLRFSGTRVEARSEDFLNAAGNFADLAQTMLIRWFEDQAIVDLADMERRARADAERTVSSLRSEGLGGILVEEARVDGLQLTSVTSQTGSLEIVAVANGVVRLRVQEIPIGR